MQVHMIREAMCDPMRNGPRVIGIKLAMICSNQ